MDTSIFTSSGRFLMLALDHRDSLKKLINANAPEKVEASVITKLKEKIIASLFDQFSSLLLDPQYGLPAYRNFLKTSGKREKPFLLCAEETGYQKTEAGRVNQLKYPVPYLKSLGASGVKLLLYFNPLSTATKNQLELAQKVFEESRKENLPFFLEIITYDLPGKKLEKSEAIIKSITMFLENNLKPDVFKLEYPGNSDGCQKITTLLKNIPWILLTRGNKYEVFKNQLQEAVKAGASGFLAGRALWQEMIGFSKERQVEFTQKILVRRFQEISSIVINS